MSVSWTISGGSLVGAVTFPAAGFGPPTRTCRSLETDEVFIPVDIAALDTAAALAYGDQVTIRRDGDIWFVGRVDATPRQGDHSAVTLAYRLVGPWWWLEQIVYQQQWYMWDTVGAALDWAYKSRVILCEDTDGTRLTTGEQITDAINWAITRGAPIAVGTIDPDLEIPWDEAVDITCAEVIRKMLHYSPDCVAWFDYTAATPTLHIRKRSSLTPITYDLDAGNVIASASIRSRDDLQAPGLTLHFEQHHDNLGETYTTIVTQTAGTTSDPRAVVSTIELAGMSVAGQVQRITTENWPATLEDKTWWKSHCAALKGFADGDITITDGTVDGAAWPAITVTYPRILVEGALQDWMVNADNDPISSTRLTVKCKVAFDVEVGGEVKHEVADRDFAATIIATDAQSKKHRRIDSMSLAEAIPADMAADIYAAYNVLHYEGTLTIEQEDVPLASHVGSLLRLSNGLAAWATMDAVIQSCADDAGAGRTVIRFGPPRQLGVYDMVALLRGFRSRRQTFRHLQRQTGKADDAGGVMEMVDKDDRPNEGGEGGIIRRFVLERTSGSGYTQKIILDADGIATLAGGHDVTIQPRKMYIYDANKNLVPVIVLCSEAVDSSLGTLASQTVVTDWQHDTSTHRFEKKTRAAYIIATASESGWTLVTGGQGGACPTT